VFAWLRQIKADHELPASAALLALELIDRFNRKQDGAGWAGCGTLGAEIGVSQSRVVRLMHLLEECGHISVEWGMQGRGHSNRYWMVLKPTSAHFSAGGKHAPAHVSEDEKHAFGDGKHAPAHRKHAPAHMNQLKNQRKNQNPVGVAYATPNGEGERENAPSARDNSPGGRAPPLRGAPAGEDRSAPVLEEREASKQGEVIAPGSFEELRAVYDRGHLDDDEAARKAFERACGEVAPEIIIAAAKVWVAAADAPRFLKPLPIWLDRRGWEKAPPSKPAAGNAARGRSPQRRNGSKVSLSRVMWDAGEEKGREKAR
jgi:hypothetical protein